MVAARIERALKVRKAMSYFGLQYRLGEVGRNRTNPCLLRHILEQPLEDSATKWLQLRPGVFTFSKLPEDDAERLAESCAVALADISEYDWTESLGSVTQKLLSRYHVSSPLQTFESEYFSSNTSLDPSTSIIICDWDTSQHTIVWLSHDTGWISPHDYRLWRVLEAGRIARLPVLIVARQLAPATFVLLKALGAMRCSTTRLL
jgi:hypothetical protein